MVSDNGAMHTASQSSAQHSIGKYSTARRNNAAALPHLHTQHGDNGCAHAAMRSCQAIALKVLGVRQPDKGNGNAPQEDGHASDDENCV